MSDVTVSTGPSQGLDLPASARAILRLLADRGPATRPNLAEGLGLSKPTVSESVSLLHRHRLVELAGVTQGATGRRAAVCRVSQDAGCTIGLDAGSTHIRVRVQTLDGQTLMEDAVSTSQRQRHVNERTITAATALLEDTLKRLSSPVRAVTVAVPTSVSPVFREPGDYQAMRRLIAELSRLSDVAIQVENNVNCAAVGEFRHGAARAHDSFSYLQVGVKIGLGTMHRGELFRGATLAAGEPARLPFPWAPGQSSAPGGLEQYLGASSLMRRCREREWADGAAPKAASELFSRAERGVRQARDIVEEYATDVGRLLAAIVCLMDPGLIVLGGGIGQNPILIPRATRTVERLAWPTSLISTALGDQATVLGATTLATDRALDDLCGQRIRVPE